MAKQLDFASDDTRHFNFPEEESNCKNFRYAITSWDKRWGKTRSGKNRVDYARSECRSYGSQAEQAEMGLLSFRWNQELYHGTLDLMTGPYCDENFH